MIEQKLLVNSIMSQHTQRGVLRLYKQLDSRINVVKFLKSFCQNRYKKSQQTSLDNFIYEHNQKILSAAMTELKYFFSRLDINNLIDHHEEWHKDAYECLNHWKSSDLKDAVNYYVKTKTDNLSKYVKQMQNKTRKNLYIQRLISAMRQAHEKGWFMVFDSLTLSDHRYKDFEQNPTAIRDHIRRIGRLINKANGRKVSEPYSDIFQYFVIPELGGKNGRLHFHCLYLFNKLPPKATDPNAMRKHATLREISALKIWEYGFTSPIAVRYSNDKFSSIGWRWPVKLKAGVSYAIPVKPVQAVAFYLVDYINKNQENKQCQNQTTTTKSKTNKPYRIRMSSNFGLLPIPTHLPVQTLIELSQIDWSVSANASLISLSSSKQLAQSLDSMSLKTYLETHNPQPSLLTYLRNMTQAPLTHNQLNSIPTPTAKLMSSAISNDAKNVIRDLEYRYGGVGITSK